MSHGHSHGIGGAGLTTATAMHRKRLVLVLAITCAVMVAEIIGAWLSGSLALLADAGHMLTDATGLAVALGASWLAQRPATQARTFGWQRAEILAALANALLLAAIGVTVIVEGVKRLAAPDVDVRPGLMIAVAVVGLAANVVGLALLRDGKSTSLNVRGAYLEVLGDALGSIAVIVAGVVIATTGFVAADGLASIAIGLMIAPRALSLLKDVSHVLLEAAPEGVDMAEVRGHILAVPHVVAVHDLHAWTITSGVPVLSAHVVVEQENLDNGGAQGVLDALRSCLASHFDVDHCTFQIECPAASAGEDYPHA